MERKIEAMHRAYGRDVLHKCKDCCNLVHTRYQRTYLKCAAYGQTSSESTDWVGKWTACGLFGKPFAGLRPRRYPLIEILKRYRETSKKAPEEPMEGQIRMEGMG